MLTIKISLMLGATALLPASLCNAAQVRQYEFGFYSGAGGAFCDGVQFTAEPGFGSGYHIYSQDFCPNPPGRLGGFHSAIGLLGPG